MSKFEQAEYQPNIANILIEHVPGALDRRIVRTMDILFRILCECRGQMRDLMQCIANGNAVAQNGSLTKDDDMIDLLHACKGCAREGLHRVMTLR